MAGMAILIPTLKYQRYWKAKWFWLVILGLLSLQLPLVILVRPFAGTSGFGFNLLFVYLDALAVIVAVNIVRPRDDSDY